MQMGTHLLWKDLISKHDCIPVLHVSIISPRSFYKTNIPPADKLHSPMFSSLSIIPRLSSSFLKHVITSHFNDYANTFVAQSSVFLTDSAHSKIWIVSFPQICTLLCGPQSDATNQQLSSMQKAATASATEPHRDPDAVDRFMQDDLVITCCYQSHGFALCKHGHYFHTITYFAAESLLST